MQSSFKKKFGRLGIVLAGLLLSGSVVTQLRATRTVAAPYPHLRASQDPAVIERGRYLVEGPAHCGDCHGAVDPPAASRMGRPLIGGLEFKLPVGTFRVPNITPDVETGIGRYRDEELARILRHGVKPNGQMALPFMPFANLSDRDLTAIVSFLRTLSPVRHRVPPHAINPLGKLVLAYVLSPKGPSETVEQNVPAEPTAAYGRYLSHNVGNCVACHTKLDQRTGAIAGPLFGGGALHDSTRDPERKFVSPNLTPHPRWGWLQQWTEDAFVARFQAGRVHADSPMPWEAFQRMNDDDLRAIYRYLQTLKPTEGGPDPKQHQVTVTAMN